MTHVETRHAIHPDHARGMDTAQLRQHFLVEGLFAAGQIRLTYTHYDRFVVGGAVPDGAPLTLDAIDETRTPSFLDRREMGIVNIGGPGREEAAGQGWDMACPSRAAASADHRRSGQEGRDGRHRDLEQARH